MMKTMQWLIVLVILQVLLLLGLFPKKTDGAPVQVPQALNVERFKRDANTSALPLITSTPSTSQSKNKNSTAAVDTLHTAPLSEVELDKLRGNNRSQIKMDSKGFPIQPNGATRASRPTSESIALSVIKTIPTGSATLTTNPILARQSKKAKGGPPRGQVSEPDKGAQEKGSDKGEIQRSYHIMIAVAGLILLLSFTALIAYFYRFGKRRMTVAPIVQDQPEHGAVQSLEAIDA